MKTFDNGGKQIGRIDQSFTVHEIRNITTISVRDRSTGKVTTETLIGQSPFGTSE
jgi:hypothetical protein